MDSRKPTKDSRASPIDIDTVIRASQAISSEIRLDRLIGSLMTLVLEHAGADAGALILCRNYRMQVTALAHTSRGTVDVVVHKETTHPLNAPESILRWVARTRQTLSVDAANMPPDFEHDPYFKARHPKTLICLPLLKQTELIGLIYLENSLVRDAFTPRRKAVLELIASQAAVSLENARLFEEVTEENRERRKVEAALRENESALAAAQRISRTGSWLLDVKRNTVSASAEHYRIFDLQPGASDLPVEAYMDRVHPEDRSTVRQRLEAAVAARSAFTSSHRLLLPDGTLRFLEVIGGPRLEDEDRPLFFGTTADVTERMHAEQALKAAQSELARVSRLTMMGELAGSIIHEINQPLAAIVTNAEASLRLLALEVPDLAETRAAIADLARDGRRMSDVVMSLRSLARKSGLRMAPVDIDDAIGEVLMFARSELDRESIHVRTDLDAAGQLVLGDRIQLQQVILNLIRNSIEAMAATSGDRRDLIISSGVSKPGEIAVAVQDNGPGIAPGIADRIFDPLFTTKANGMGLGLSICRSIVAAHGGRIAACARLPRGTTFRFTLRTDSER